MTTRYFDWHHVRVPGGDRAAAAPYIGAARLLLGEVFEEAEVNGLGVHALTRKLDDGTVIIAEKHGDIPRVTIVPVPLEGEEEERPKGDFVVWARNEVLVDGIHEDSPQQILQYTDGRWKTYFYSGEAEGYDAFSGARGTYINMFPDGIPRAGNLDWRGRAGQRIQWHGPSTRYWYDPFVQMVAQYGTKVYMLGQVVLDTPQYIVDSTPDAGFNEQYILGAGIRGLWLYVVQVQAQNLSVPVPNPPDYGPGPYFYFAPAYTPFDVDTVVCRYRLIPRADGNPGYQVSSRSREVLWSGAVTRGVAPWFFNNDCSEAVTFIPPEIQAYGSSLFIPTVDAATTMKVMTIDHESNGPITPIVDIDDLLVSLDPGGGEAPIAADYDVDGNRVEIRVRRRNLGLPNDATGFLSQRFDILCGGAEVELRDLFRETGTENHWENRRWLMWADAREGVLVTRRQYTHFRDPPGSGTAIPSTQVWLEVWIQGALALSRTDGRADVTEDNNSFGTWLAFNSNPSDRQSDNLPQALAPLLPIYGWCWGNTPLSSPHQITGHHAGFCYLPRQPAAMFGYTLLGTVIGSTDVPAVRRIYADEVNSVPDSEKLDFDGMDSVLGAAASEGVVLLSAYPKGAGRKAADHVAISAADRQLPDLTGVPPPLESYDPIWLLGEPPRPFA